ncbi:MAG: ABC transporter permease [Bacteroidetes bacterium]|nr:ABC transporter permease [Bacteroidota bacterium]
MNLELFIAKRILSNTKGNFSRPIVKIAIISIALGLATMIVSVAIVTGFQSEIRDKVIGFGSHIQISNYDSNVGLEPTPISKNQEFYPSITNIDGIRHIQVFAYKFGIIKTDEQFEGVLLKGVGSDFDWDFFKKNMVEGDVFTVSDTAKTNEIIISKYLASRLKFKTGDKLIMNFIVDNDQRARAFKIAGIYFREEKKCLKRLLHHLHLK